MRDTIRVGDIVCYSCNNRVVIGKVTRISVGGHLYYIVPLEGGRGKYAKTRKASELITASRLNRITENSKYVE